jgi:uncharacterized membrane protein YhaH (DUF805 family)
MKFGAAVRACYKNWKDFRGSASRSEFWWFQLYLFLATLAILVLGLVLALSLDAVGGLLAVLVVLTFTVMSLVPSISVSVRRLRDGGFPWALIFLTFVPLGGLALFIMFLLPSREVEPAKAPQQEIVVESEPAEEKPQAPESAPIARPSKEEASKLERLGALHAEGKITDAQFELAKIRLRGE